MSELKLIAAPELSADQLRSALGELGVLKPSRVVRLHDVLLDTRSRCLARAGLSARWRRGEGLSTLEIEPVPIDPAVPVRRGELRTTLARGEDAARALRELVHHALPLRLRGLPIAECELRWTRELSRLQVDGCSAAVRLDLGSVSRPGARRGAPFLEVRLQQEVGDEVAFAALAERVAAIAGLSPMHGARRRRAYELLGLPTLRLTPAAPTFGPLTVADELARRVCATQLETMRAYERGSRVGLDPEHVHKMRVACRRLRAALRVFAACFDGRTSERLLTGLRWLASTLGEVRDLDVQLLELAKSRARLGPEPAAGWTELRTVLEHRRDHARACLIAGLDSERYARLLDAAARAFAIAPRRRAAHPGAQTAVVLAQQILERRVKSFVRAAKVCRQQPTVARMHELRIRGKKLRYACEFFGPLYGEEFAAGVEGLGVFQDALGQFQDQVVAGALARQLRDEALAAGSSSELLYVLGQLAAASLIGVERPELELASAWEHLGGAESVRSLARQAQRRAEEVARAIAPTPTEGS
jgi:triphosphatase